MSEFKIKYKSNLNITYSCKYHVVWRSKYRRKVLINEVDNRLKNIILAACKEFEVELFEMEVMNDHVHILVEVDPQFGLHRFVKKLKGRSSRILRKEFSWFCSKLPTLWTNSYFVTTVGGAPMQNNKTIYRKAKVCLTLSFMN